jgi:pimeloyl-ACP methyl ester carboxylesterase
MSNLQMLANGNQLGRRRVIEPKKRDLVIVHGAWTGAWSWQRVVDLLAARGYRAFVSTLTGLGERSHLASRDVTLDTHIDDIVNEMTWKDLTDVVLVAHSYGGIVATGVIERVPERIASVVYLEAIIPEDNSSFADMAPNMDFTGITVPAPQSEPGDYLREADLRWSNSKATPHPSGSFTQKLRVTGAYQRVPKKTYIVATGWEGFGEVAKKYRSDPMWTVREIPCGHDVPIDMPDELTQMLIEAA